MPDSNEILHQKYRLQVLHEAAIAVNEHATDAQKLIERIVRITADIIGDGCMVTLLQPDGENLMVITNAHRDRNLEDDYRALLKGMGPLKLNDGTDTAEVMRTGSCQLAEVTPELMVTRVDENFKPIIKRLNIHSYAIIPIRAGTNVIGTLALIRSGPDRGYTPNDIILLLELASQVGPAILAARELQNP